MGGGVVCVGSVKASPVSDVGQSRTCAENTCRMRESGSWGKHQDYRAHQTETQHRKYSLHHVSAVQQQAGPIYDLVSFWYNQLIFKINTMYIWLQKCLINVSNI